MSFLIEYLIPFLVVLTVLVFVHELGHYLVARYNGVRIEVFSIGFGPELFGWTDRVQTRWKFSVIPLGGYVRMYGDADASSRPDHEALKKAPDELRQQSLHSKTPWQRIAISAAGPLANFLFSFIVLSLLFIIKGQPIYPAKVGSVVPGLVAEKAGLQINDKILEVNHESIRDFTHLRDIIRSHGGKELVFQVERQQEVDQKKSATTQIMTITLTPEMQDGTVKPLGIRPGMPDFVQQSPLAAFSESIVFIYHVCSSLTQAVGQLVVGKGSTDDFGGILSIGSMAGNSAKGGISALFLFMALLSVNLGMINLFPVPMLDGGHILFYVIEIVRGKPVGEKSQEYAFIIGFVLVMGLMLFSTWNDLVRFKVISWLLGKGNN
jgi:regulator of sigma E protease